MSTRRSFLGKLALLGAGAGGLWLMRDRLMWPEPMLAVGGDSSGWLPFASRRQPLVSVRVGVGGRTVTALIDSGAEFSAIDRELAQAMGAVENVTAPIVAYGVGGHGQVARTSTFDVQIGGLVVRQLRAAVLELGLIAEGGPHATPLILGQEVLRAAIADIDFPNRRVRLVRREAFDLPPGAQVAPVQADGRALAARVLVEGTEIEVLVDTGASAALSLSAAVAEPLGLLDRPSRPGQALVLGGVAPGRIVRVERMVFAGQVLEDEEVHIFQPQRLPGFPKGLLGYGMLHRFRTILDHRRGAMHLIR